MSDETLAEAIYWKVENGKMGDAVKIINRIRNQAILDHSLAEIEQPEDISDETSRMMSESGWSPVEL